MKNLVIGTLVMLSTSMAFAADSSWLLCKGPANLGEDKINIVINSLEHRNGADARINELTLIYGSRLIVGSFDSTEADSAQVDLNSIKGDSKFSGKVSFNYQDDTSTINGKITLDGEVLSLDANLSCEEMN